LRRRRGEWVRDVLAEQLDHARRRARVLAGQRRHQLLLAIARDTGNAENFSGTHLEADVGEVHAEVVFLGQREAAHVEHDNRPAGPGCAGAAAARRRSSGATNPALVSVRGSTSPVTLPRATPCSGGQRTDLVELVADVENAGALARELAQGDEELCRRPAA